MRHVNDSQQTTALSERERYLKQNTHKRMQANTQKI